MASPTPAIPPGALETIISEATMGHSNSKTLRISPRDWLTRGKRVDFVGANRVSLRAAGAAALIESTPRASATGFWVPCGDDSDWMRDATWTWRVDPLHKRADVRSLASEDVGASLLFVFGQPSFWHRDVPTLAYIWSSTPVPSGSIVPSARYKSLRYIQLRGRHDAPRIEQERRDIKQDFKAAFGIAAPRLKFVALFNDNDQTREPCNGLFGEVAITA